MYYTIITKTPEVHGPQGLKFMTQTHYGYGCRLLNEIVVTLV